MKEDFFSFSLAATNVEEFKEFRQCHGINVTLFAKASSKRDFVKKISLIPWVSSYSGESWIKKRVLGCGQELQAIATDSSIYVRINREEKVIGKYTENGSQFIKIQPIKVSVPPPPPCEECDKLNSRTEEWNTIFQFIEWLEEEGFRLCKLHGIESFEPILIDLPSLLYEYFGIDPSKLEKERKELLDWMRNKN